MKEYLVTLPCDKYTGEPSPDINDIFQAVIKKTNLLGYPKYMYGGMRQYPFILTLKKPLKEMNGPLTNKDLRRIEKAKRITWESFLLLGEA